MFCILVLPDVKTVMVRQAHKKHVNISFITHSQAGPRAGLFHSLSIYLLVEECPLPVP